jgi:predicted DCC family thiol-disulfide oxidoreductase YuxK
MGKAPDKMTVYYNGACPVCRFEMEHYQKLAADRADEFNWCDVAEKPQEAAQAGLDWHTALRRLHVRAGDGRMGVGLDAMTMVWGRFAGYRWAARFFNLSLINPVSAWVYEHIVARALYLWSRSRGAGQCDCRPM